MSAPSPSAGEVGEGGEEGIVFSPTAGLPLPGPPLPSLGRRKMLYRPRALAVAQAVFYLCVCCIGAHFRRLQSFIMCHDPPQYYSLSRVSERGGRVLKTHPIMPKNHTKVCTKLLRGARPSTTLANAFAPDNDNAVWYSNRIVTIF